MAVTCLKSTEVVFVRAYDLMRWVYQQSNNGGIEDGVHLSHARVISEVKELIMKLLHKFLRVRLISEDKKLFYKYF
jgi:hypothetical protein